jgi:PKHD-type hydroxylase
VHLCIENVLTAEELRQVCAGLRQGKFEDGRVTAGWIARDVKHNLQLEPQSKEAEAARQVVVSALLRCQPFEMAARPKLLRPPMLARYEVGMEYGWHTDDPLMGNPIPLRTDVAFTLFLAAPEEYDGGELVVGAADGERRYKLPAGHMVLYPASTLHRVAQVTRGVRLVAVSWLQSRVRDPAQRELLYDLELARQAMFERSGKTPEFDRITKTFANLVRMWAEP